MKIRTMTIEDYDEVYALWLNTPGMGLNVLDDSKIGIDKYLQRNPTTCFVAEKDNTIVGVLLSGHDGRRGFIYHTAVALSERGKGIGRALVDNAIEALRAEGINKVALVVIDANKIGNDFWEHLGFTKRDDLIYRNKVITILDMQSMNT